MGVVYEAEQISLGRTVAVKVLPFPAMLDKRQLRQFQNEARAAATLNHPHIVPVYFVGIERGVHYYAMQLIQGSSLARVLEQLRGDTTTGFKPVTDRVCEPTALAAGHDLPSEPTALAAGHDLPSEPTALAAGHDLPSEPTAH